jgi:hypothetical protein
MLLQDGHHAHVLKSPACESKLWEKTPVTTSMAAFMEMVNIANLDPNH